MTYQLSRLAGEFTRRSVRRLPILPMLALCLIAASPAHADEAEDLRAQNAILQARIAELEATVAELRVKLERYEQREEAITQREAAVERMAGVVSSEELAEQYDAQIVAETNEQTGNQTITAGPVRVEDEDLRGDWFISLVSTRSNTQDLPPVSLYVQGWYSGVGLTVNGNGRGGDVTTLTFLVDDQPLELNVESVERTSVGTGIRASGKRTENRSETAKIVLTPETLRRLAYATRLEVVLPRGTLNLQREQRALLRGVLERLEQR